MKRILGTIIAAALLSTVVTAQNEDYRSTLSVGAGFTLGGALVKAVETAALGTVDSKTLPAIEVAYDFGVAKWFSIGAMATYQSLSLEEVLTGGTSEYSVSRLYVGTSLLFHYANNGRVDLYSGFRVGYKNWSSSATLASGASDIGIEDLSFFGDGVAFQAVLFGLRGYVTDNIGIQADILGIGAPHIASLGLSFRF